MADAAPDLSTRIAHLEAELSALKRQQRDEDDRRLLVSIVRRIGFVVFDGQMLQAHRRIDPTFAAALGELTPRQLGKRFARMVGRDLRGLTLSRVKETEDGWMWEIHFHEPSGRVDATRAD